MKVATPTAPITDSYRGRFAPSPTGPLHFGSLIAALGSFLEARQHGGEWLVRIEDVDVQRARPGAADVILRALERHQLPWDGPVLRQSQRTEAYQAALRQLIDAGLVYPCVCTRRELADCPRNDDGSPRYPGYCRDHPPHTNRATAIRLYVGDASLTFQDAIQGAHRQQLAREVGDFVIRRADGLFAYQLAVVVDDAAQGITHIVRGGDLLNSTARQIYLQQLLGFSTPQYAHLPIAVDDQGHKLSKHTGAPALDLVRPGPALWEALHFLGQSPPSDLRRAPPPMIMAWALTHWRFASVPATLSRRCALHFTGPLLATGKKQNLSLPT